MIEALTTHDVPKDFDAVDANLSLSQRGVQTEELVTPKVYFILSPLKR